MSDPISTAVAATDITQGLVAATDITQGLVAATDVTQGLVDAVAGVASLPQGSEGVLIAAGVVNLVIFCLKNASRVPLLDKLQLDILINKIPGRFLPLVITGLTVTVSVLTAVSQGSSITGAVLNAVLVSTGAVGINEVIRPLKTKANLK